MDSVAMYLLVACIFMFLVTLFVIIGVISEHPAPFLLALCAFFFSVAMFIRGCIDWRQIVIQDRIDTAVKQALEDSKQ